VLITAAATVALGRHPHPLQGSGLCYHWLALPVVVVAWRAAGVRRAAAWGLLGTLAAAAILALVQYTYGLREDLRPFRVGTGEGSLRFTFANGFFSTHLTLAAVALALLVALAGRLRRELPTWAGWTAVGLAAALLVLSSGRLAYVGLVAALLTWGMLGGGRRALAALGAGALVLTVAIGVLAATQPARLQAMARGEDGRWMIWRTSAAIIAESPLLGTGGQAAFTDRYRVLNPQLHDGRTGEFPLGAPHAHNSLIALAAEHGLPAAVLYLGFLGAILLASWRRRHQDPDSWRLAAALIVGMLGAGMFEHLAADAESSIALAALLGAITARTRPEDRHDPDPAV
jgi:O-antigen ligase